MVVLCKGTKKCGDHLYDIKADSGVLSEQTQSCDKDRANEEKHEFRLLDILESK